MSGQRSLEDRLELIIRRTKENDATASRSRIVHAFQIASELHAGVMRKDGVTPYIDHPVSVAEIVANNGGDQTMVISSLLHDTVEDTPYTLQSMAVTFGQDVANVVDALTQVEAHIPDHITDSHQRRLIKNYVDGLSNAKLLDPSNPQSGKAIYIKLADRLHNMRTLGACSKRAQSNKASDTLQFFVPLARLIRSKYFERELSELCFQVLQPDLYEDISFAYEEARSRNSRHIAQFMKSFDLALRKNRNGAALFRKTSSDSLKCYQIRNLLGINSRPYGSMGSFSKSSIFLYEIVLEYYGDDASQMLPAFIDLYLAELRQNDIDLEVDFGYPSKEAVAFCLTDALSNRYLVVLQPAKPFSAVSDYASLFPPASSVTEMPEKTITVYSKDGEPYQMIEGSTVLDFAFRIHPDLGCSALYGLIRRGNGAFQTLPNSAFSETVICTPDDVECEINHPLQDGDYVFIVNDVDDLGEPVYHVNYEWFGYVKTQYAIDHLVEFLQKMLPNAGVYSSRISWEPTASQRYGA